MLKKAGMVVLGATAGMLSLAPLASAGEAPSHGGDHGNHGQHESRAGGDCASAVSGGQGNSGRQLIGANNVNVQAPINQLGVLAEQHSDCGGGHGGHGHGRHGGHGHDRDGDRGDRGGRGGASAVSGGQGNSGDQLIGLNNVNAQIPINQLGILADQD
jgi:hypothetical protein